MVTDSDNPYTSAEWRDRFRLDGKVAVVTGASSGLGVAIAQGMAAAGADVAIGARRIDMLDETRALVEGLGRRCVAVETDVTRVEDCERLVATAVDRLGGCDVLVNNAGVGGDYNAATEDPPEHFRSVVDVNLFGSYWMAQAAGRAMPPGSAVVNISSVMAVTTAKMPAAGYSSAKAGVLGMTRDLAAQWGPRGIRVNAILPGSSSPRPRPTTARGISRRSSTRGCRPAGSAIRSRSPARRSSSPRMRPPTSPASRSPSTAGSCSSEQDRPRQPAATSMTTLPSASRRSRMPSAVVARSKGSRWPTYGRTRPSAATASRPATSSGA